MAHRTQAAPRENQVWATIFIAELCVLRTSGGVNFSLVFICVQSVSEFLWDGLHASTEFPVMPKHAQYAARFGGEYPETVIV